MQYNFSDYLFERIFRVSHENENRLYCILHNKPSVNFILFTIDFSVL